ncbi:hypothetical protein GE107_08275 [Cohnella sp. CFH 77786]|uniref:hypothetical protein n=1 Tax=Cohnella sp. CFH 77786 TaxID=2662265 RepID=UPI001C608F20|nr:hypothetical protein [Cohnella sp. CFH 77786]MBW5446056.1 hypothetical protein [Cohnella sp. CFH 77786]
MSWPDAFGRFLEREVPKFIHLAACRPDRALFSCRAYACRPEAESGAFRVYIRNVQWQRIREDVRSGSRLAVLLTSGVDNESYQVKGTFAGVQAMDTEDCAFLKREQNRIRIALPDMFVPPIAVAPMECVSVILVGNTYYIQTPGPSAGCPIPERSGTS